MMDAFDYIELAESANISMSSIDSYKTFKAKNGWQVTIFYDCGDFDYIDHFIDPNGNIINFWSWPESISKSILMAWAGPGDIERLKKCVWDQDAV